MFFPIKGIFLLFFDKLLYPCIRNTFCMKIINWFLNRIAIGGSMIACIFTGIAGLILMLSVIFNFPPYLSGKNWSFGFIDFKKGIPYNTYAAGGSIPDCVGQGRGFEFQPARFLWTLLSDAKGRSLMHSDGDLEEHRPADPPRPTRWDGSDCSRASRRLRTAWAVQPGRR